MQTLLIELNNPKAFNLIQELEDLHIIRIIKNNTETKKVKLSEKYKGVFSNEDAIDFDKHTQNSRKEWDNI